MKIKLILLSLMLLFNLNCEAWDFMVDNIGYTIISDQEMIVHVSSYDEQTDSYNLYIPETVTKYDKTYTVVGIDKNSFGYNSEITNIYIPKTISSISEEAFGSVSLQNINIDKDNPYYKSIDGVLLDIDSKRLIRFPRGRKGYQELPEGIETICKWSFSGCGLSSLKMPNSVITIEDFSFNFCFKLDDIIFSENLEKIGFQAFCDCAFMEINLPQSLKYIGDDAFNGCEHLRSINIPKNVEYIGYDGIALGFLDGLKSISIDESNKYYTVKDNILYNKDMTILLKCPANTDAKIIKIPDTVKEIASCAFHSSNGIEKVYIPASVSTIRAGAFYYCTNINEVYSYALEPPVTPKEESKSEDPWEYSNRSNATLYVPKGCIDLYREVSVLEYAYKNRYVHPWGEFKEIIDELDATSISMTKDERIVSKAIYSLTGSKVNEVYRGGIIIKDGKKYLKKK